MAAFCSGAAPLFHVLQNFMATKFLPSVAPKTVPSGIIMVYFQSRMSLLKPTSISCIKNNGPTAILRSGETVKLSFAGGDSAKDKKAFKT